MRILVHVCCAHCLGKLLAGLADGPEAYEPVLYWDNPNIHPLIEYRRRLKAVKMLAERAALPLIAEEGYGLVDFCRAVHGREEAPLRCVQCYILRMGRAAAAADREGCSVYTSTLVTSCHQDHRLIREAGDMAGHASGVAFLYRDWRETQADPALTGMLYHQQYCGCIFSEYDRFKDTTTHLWPPPVVRASEGVKPLPRERR
ncbi:MAG: epoxyqueuosine reductase QueH [Verrucomicrobiota bacterium]|jgi:predicted adenine nucleotide alpha hydrolase (AANH) superfamily ATPase|nr:epoxyqueuosine reductase QueH [Verrucomicrobiota bacterium]